MEKYKAGYKKKYWFVNVEGNSFSVCEDVNTFSLKHISRFILGNMFPDKEQAIAGMKAMINSAVDA